MPKTPASPPPGAVLPGAGAGSRTVTIPGSLQVDYASHVTGRPYRLQIHIPDTPPPDGGFPLLIVLDGNLYFAGTVDGVRLQGRHFITPPVIVAIGYQTDDLGEQLTLRTRDLTPWIEAEKRMRPVYLAVSGGQPLADSAIGGVDPFLDMIEQEVIPFAQGLARIDPAWIVLFGHSLGGRTALQALFTRTSRYWGCVASAPSIWWDDFSILREEERFRRTLAGSLPPRLLLAVGGLEEEIPRTLTPLPGRREDILATLAALRMVGAVEQLGLTLSTVPGYGPDRLQTVVFPDEDHVSVVPAVIARALRFMFGRKGPER